MESHTQQQTEDGGSNKANLQLCRQSSTRWTPTTDQIRILKELYYNKGVRSPSAEQIQRICVQLKKYGKIEGKNVFYWFQNHKARERQKKRYTADVHVSMQRSGLVGSNGANWKTDDQYVTMNNKYSNICQGVPPASATASSAGMIAFNGQMGNYAGYGSMNMEKSFRDCSISAGSGTSTTGVGVGVHGSINPNFGSWIGGSLDPYSSSSYTTATSTTTFFDMKEQSFMDQQHEDHRHQEIETLPLFPMHGEDIFGPIKTTSENGGNGYGYFSGSWDNGYNGGPRSTSLELSLNSYGYNTTNYY